MAQNTQVTDEELLAQLGGLGTPLTTGSTTGSDPTTSTSSTTTWTKTSGSHTPRQSATANNSKRSSSSKAPAPSQTNEDPLAALKSLAKARPASRPQTPRSTANNTRRHGDPVVSHTSASTGSRRTSEDHSRLSGASLTKSSDGAVSLQDALPSTREHKVRAREAKEQQPPHQSAPGNDGGWWGGLFATATAAVSQAQNVVKEIQKNQEAQKWASQVKGNVSALRGLGGELTARALPTFADILNTIVPPISQHECLQIHISHDLIGYPSLNPSIYAIFSRIMSQVEGGHLLVIQRGSESRGPSSSTSGWTDGPWWRDGQTKRNLGLKSGLTQGTNLARANAEAHANEYYAANNGLDAAYKAASQGQSEANPVRTSDIFIALQVIAIDQHDDSLFQGLSDKAEEKVEDKSAGPSVNDQQDEPCFCFAIYLHDPVHAINFKTVTQSLPRQWADWLDAEQDPSSSLHLPREIHDIVQAGGIDPREWISEWVEETITIGVGITAQRYVAERMGVGEGSILIDNPTQTIVDAGAGKLSRA